MDTKGVGVVTCKVWISKWFLPYVRHVNASTERPAAQGCLLSWTF